MRTLHGFVLLMGFVVIGCAGTTTGTSRQFDDASTGSGGTAPSTGGSGGVAGVGGLAGSGGSEATGGTGGPSILDGSVYADTSASADAGFGTDASVATRDARGSRGLSGSTDAGACSPTGSGGSNGAGGSGAPRDAGDSGDAGSRCPFTQLSRPTLWAQACPDKSHYADREAITFTYRIENRGANDESVTVNGNCSDYSYSVVGVGQVFCNCDYGLCAPAPHDILIPAGGAYIRSIPWDQRIFFGPSDTGQQPGGQVPDGTYTISAQLLSNQAGETARSSFVIGPASTGGGKNIGTLFGAPASYAVGDNAQFVAAADFDGDARLDLAVAQGNTAEIDVLHGLGDGTFACPKGYAIGSGAESLAAGDSRIDQFVRSGRFQP